MALLTPEEIKQFKNPDWRLDNLYKIKTKNQKTIKFKKNEVQSRLDKNATGLDVVLKARQVGVSTYFLLKKLDKAIFTRNYTVAILSHERKSMEILFSMIRRAHKYMNPKVQPVIAKGGGSKYEMVFPDMDSKIYCTMEAVSDTVNDLHISEMALMKNADRVNTSMDAVPIGGNISIETTPRGYNFFQDFWTDSDSIFKKHFFPWYLDSGYAIKSDKFKLTPDETMLIKYAKSEYGIKLSYDQIAFRRFKIKQKDNDLDGFLQEFAENDVSCFIATGQSFLDSMIMSKLIKEDYVTTATEGGLTIYKEFNKNHDYVCGADTAEGVGGDYSVGIMIDVTTMEVVAQLRGQIKPSDFAHSLKDLCQLYQSGGSGYPLLGVERNNHGHAVLLELVEHINYVNVFMDKDERPGWLTNRVSKPIMLNTLKDGLESYNLKVYSKELLSEALTLINNNGKIEASEGKHDDIIIATAIALQMCIKNQSINLDNIENRMML